MSRRNRSDYSKRDSHRNTTRSVLRTNGESDVLTWLQGPPVVSPGPLWSGDLVQVEDNRLYSPEVYRTPSATYKPAKLLSGAPARVEIANTVGRSLSAQLGFHDAQKVVRCMRRTQRREVLHALKKTGRGSGGGKKHRNVYSNIRCK